MTAAQRATLETARFYHAARVFEYRETGETAMADTHQRVADALRAALGTCGTCAHAGERIEPNGWHFCAAPAERDLLKLRFPFRSKAMPLGERCTGWTAKEGA